jgi:hypothetical protein
VLHDEPVNRFKIIAVTTASAICVVTSPLTSAAHATTPSLTVSAPSVVNYFAPATITGTTATPRERYSIHVEYAPGSYQLRPGRSDAAGKFSVTLQPTADTTFYVTSDGATTAAHTIHVATASCTTTGPAFTTLRGVTEDSEEPTFAAFNTERNGLWAGVEWDGGDLDLISWHSGQHSPTLLGQFSQIASAFVGPFASLRAVGITPAGGVVAVAQLPDNPKVGYQQAGYLYLKGKRYTLTHEPTWTSVVPVGVTDDGTIVGWVQVGPTGHARTWVEEWNSSGSGHHMITPISGGPSLVAVDGEGDVSLGANGVASVWVAATHKIVPLGAPAGASNATNFVYVGGTTASFYGYTDSYDVAKWGVSSTANPLPVVDLVGIGEPIGASGYTDVLMLLSDIPSNAVLITRNHKLAPIPTQGTTTVQFAGDTMITPGGTVAYTGNKDHLIHFMTCK